MKTLALITLLAVGSSPSVVDAADTTEPTVNVVVAEVVSSKLVSLDPSPGMAAAGNQWHVHECAMMSP